MKVETNPDYRDLFRELNSARARFLVVGAYAVIFHAEPRFTRDIDLWVEPTPENADRVWTALAQFGAPLSDLTKADLCKPAMVYQIGVAPNRIEVAGRPQDMLDLALLREARARRPK